jgi:TatD DNase family protein
MDHRFVDNHAHLNFNAFRDDLEDVIKRARDAGTLIINVGTQRDTSKRAVEIAEKYDNCYAIVGLHPVHTGKSFHDEKEIGPAFAKAASGKEGFTSRGEVFDYEYYKELAMHPKVVGIGECGLDYYRLEKDTKDVQRKAFEEQIKLAIEIGKPLMLHVREAYEDALTILRQYPGVKGDTHFFAGDTNIAKQFLDLGFTLSFTGAITYGTNYKEVIEITPLDRILSETDCPYVAPVPYRGKRNEPVYVVEIVKKIAEIKNVPFEEVREVLRVNSKRLFGL